MSYQSVTLACSERSFMRSLPTQSAVMIVANLSHKPLCQEARKTITLLTKPLRLWQI